MPVPRRGPRIGGAIGVPIVTISMGWLGAGPRIYYLSMANKRKKRYRTQSRPLPPPVTPAHAPKSMWRKLVPFIVFSMLGLFCWGLYADFVPSPFWQSLCLKLSLEITAILSLLFYWGLWTGRLNADHLDGYAEVMIVVLFAPVVLFFWTFVVLQQGVGDLANRVIGKTESVTMQFHLGKYDDEDGCRNMTGIVEGKKTPEDFCLPYDAISYVAGGAFLPQTFAANITTKHSRLGRQRLRMDTVRRWPA
jgi:hypothetical protein